MVMQNQPLGVCPFCGSTLDTGSILIEYESNGTERLFAECYACEQPVHPEWFTGGVTECSFSKVQIRLSWTLCRKESES